MGSEIKNKMFIRFVLQAAIAAGLVLCLICGVNYFVDASGAIAPSDYEYMAKLSLSGEIVATAENYNDRLYQVVVVDQMDEMPETLVVGSSRGMFLGEEITGYEHLYNCCVTGASLEDYYALIGLYYQKFSKLPPRIIIETSPFIFIENDTEDRWKEQPSYALAAKNFYEKVNHKTLEVDTKKDNLYLSLSYFQYNAYILMHQGLSAFDLKRTEVSVSTDSIGPAEYPDGTMRYPYDLQNPSEARLQNVQGLIGAITYRGLNKTEELGETKAYAYEHLVKFLLDHDVDVCIYMQPFSATRCHYIYDKNMNPIVDKVENYLLELGAQYGIKVIGGYNTNDFGLSDEYFVDDLHLDKAGVKILWDLCN